MLTLNCYKPLRKLRCHSCLKWHVAFVTVVIYHISFQCIIGQHEIWWICKKLLLWNNTEPAFMWLAICPFCALTEYLFFETECSCKLIQDVGFSRVLVTALYLRKLAENTTCCMMHDAVAYLYIQHVSVCISIHFELCFWPSDECKSNIHFTFSWVVVSTNSREENLALSWSIISCY